MSLLLRKNCQPILDGANLAEYHVDIAEQKYLRIVTECGKPLVNIFGIKFNRLSPNEAEIEYATELLDNFMGTHLPLLNEYMEKKEAYKRNRVPKNDDWPVRLFENYQSDHRPVAQVEYKEGLFEHSLRYYMDDGSYTFRSKLLKDQMGEDFSIKHLTDAKCDKKLFNKVKVYLGKYIERDKMEKELNELLSKVAACDI